LNKTKDKNKHQIGFFIWKEFRDNRKQDGCRFSFIVTIGKC